MGVINTNFVANAAPSSPQTVSIILDKGAGNNRMVVLGQMINDVNPAAHIATFDPGGADEVVMNVLLVDGNALTQNSGATDEYVGAFWLKDDELPASPGTYNIDITYTLVSDGEASVVYYLEDVEQTEPLVDTVEANITQTPQIVTGAGVTDIVLDFWQSNENFGTYTPDSGQTAIMVADIDEIAFSSHAVGQDPMGWTNDQATDQSHIGLYVVISPAAGGTPFSGNAERSTQPLTSYAASAAEGFAPPIARTEHPIALRASRIIAGPLNVGDILRDKNGTLQSSLSSLKWAWFDADPSTGATPTDYGQAESTDGAGLLYIELINSALVSGQTGWLALSDATNTNLGLFRLSVRNYFES